MSFKQLITEAHKRAAKQVKIYAKILRLSGKYTYRSVLGEMMKNIYHEIKTGINAVLDFEKHLTCNF
jgi:predicted DNA-binding protein YlxM (UPF0122 family)